MRSRILHLSFPLLLVASILTATTAAANRLVPVGPEFQVNTQFWHVQKTPAAAMSPDGSFVVAWVDDFHFSSGHLFYQRYDASGTALGAAVDLGPGGSVAAAMDAANGFVLTWSGVFAARFDDAGTPLGAPFVVSSPWPFAQQRPSVAREPGGDFVVVWESDNQEGNPSWGIYGQRLDATGAPVGPEFQVNSYTPEDQRSPSVAVDADGDFVAVYETAALPPGLDIFGQRFDSSGAAQGPEFIVNSTTADVQQTPSVAMDAAGNFVVVWNSDQLPATSNDIFGQRFDSSGGTLGGEFQVNTHTASAQRAPVVADMAGGFAVAWEGFHPDDPDLEGVFLRSFDGSGTPTIEETRVNRFTPGRQRSPSLATDAQGNAVVVWESSPSSQTIPQDGDLSGIFAQRFANCGNGSLFPGEECDDGNNLDGDGCSASCRDELPVLAVASWSLDDSAGNADGSLDPHESTQLLLELENLGFAGATGLSATLTSLTPGVTVGGGPVTYPDLPIGSSAFGAQPFGLTLGALACGSGLQLQLDVSSGQGTLQSGFVITVGSPNTLVLASADVPKPLPDPGTVLSTLTIPGNLLIEDLDVVLDLTHPSVGQLEVVLTSPSGTPVELFSGVGGTGADFSGTLLDDEASFLLAFSTAPFSGAFVPPGKLSDFDGEDAQGVWTLSVTDLLPTSAGSLDGWSLQLEGSSCDPLQCTDPDGDTFLSEGGTCGPLDCDGQRDDSHPGAPELCDGRDNDCDGRVDGIFRTSSDTPLAIPDLGSALSTIAISNPAAVADLNVRVRTTHQHHPDLDVFLEAPSPFTEVELFTDIDRGGPGFDDVLDDEAEFPLSISLQAKRGPFQPEGSLADLDGELAQGTWTLRVTDDNFSNTGTLESWSLEIQLCPCGNGVVDFGEDCDDGNVTAGDCCGPFCQYETGPGAPPCCSAGLCQVGAGCGSVCFMPGGLCSQPAGLNTACSCVIPVCGNSVLDPGEECDDGNTIPGDGCDASCIIEHSCADEVPLNQACVSWVFIAPCTSCADPAADAACAAADALLCNDAPANLACAQAIDAAGCAELCLCD